MTLPDDLAVTTRVAAALERLGVRWLVGGSLASSFHGEPRSTNDADVVAELTEAHVDALVADLGDEFYVSADAVRDAVRRGASFNVIHLATMFKVDVFVLRGGDEFARAEMDRRERHDVAVESNDALYFASAEDTVLQKLVWFRRGGGISERQWRDVLGVLRVQAGALDIAYMQGWSKQLGVSDLLERALAHKAFGDQS